MWAVRVAGHPACPLRNSNYGAAVFVILLPSRIASVTGRTRRSRFRFGTGIARRFAGLRSIWRSDAIFRPTPAIEITTSLRTSPWRTRRSGLGSRRRPGTIPLTFPSTGRTKRHGPVLRAPRSAGLIHVASRRSGRRTQAVFRPAPAIEITTSLRTSPWRTRWSGLRSRRQPGPIPITFRSAWWTKRHGPVLLSPRSAGLIHVASRPSRAADPGGLPARAGDRNHQVPQDLAVADPAVRRAAPAAAQSDPNRVPVRVADQKAWAGLAGPKLRGADPCRVPAFRAADPGGLPARAGDRTHVPQNSPWRTRRSGVWSRRRPGTIPITFPSAWRTKRHRPVLRAPRSAGLIHVASRRSERRTQAVFRPAPVVELTSLRTSPWRTRRSGVRSRWRSGPIPIRVPVRVAGPRRSWPRAGRRSRSRWPGGCGGPG